MKKVYTSAFKAQVVLELLKEEKTLAQISAQYGVHANVLRDWRMQALKGLPSLFERRDDVAELKAAHAEQVEDLYAQIDRLTTQFTWLKKSCQPPLSDPTSVNRSGGRDASAHAADRLTRYQPNASLLSTSHAVTVRSCEQAPH
jgi:transposase